MEAPTNQCDLVPPALKAFCESKRNQRIRTDAAFAFSAALVVILVSLGGWGHRYRHHFLTRLLLLGASTLFLPVLSYVVSAINTANQLSPGVEWCYEYGPALLLTWAALVPLVAINTATLVTAGAGAGDGEDRSISPLWELMARLSWTSCLTFYCREKKVADRTFLLFNLVTCALGIVEILLKIFSFEKARRSFALGPRNPRLIAGYMDQLRNRRGDEQVVDLLVVMGEDEQEIEEGPVGYRFKGLHERGNGSLVTLQRVRSMASSADGVLSSLMPPIQDLCLSFSLFKLMRRRFAGCRIMEQGHGVAAYLLDSRDPESVVRIIADELSFLCDLYYSSLPVSYSSGWSPVASILVSLVIVTYCLAAGVYWFWAITHDHRHPLSDYQFSQIYCQLESNQRMAFGNVLFALVLTAILLIAVVLAEAWAITSYFCSNWTKVTLICYYITNSSWQRSPAMIRWISLLLRCRNRFMNYWSDKMGQTCILESHLNIRRSPFQLADRTKLVKIPIEVKTAMLDSLKRSHMRLSNGIAFLRQSQIGNDVHWACEGEGTSDVILVWHIATSIFEIRYMQHHPDACSSKDRVVATYLSRYCAYLLASAPEFLPDDKAWSKKLYESVEKIVKPILRNCGVRPLDYELLIGLLDEKSKDCNVLGKGMKLGKHLVDEIEIVDEKMGWEILAGFWSEMILFIVPSDNIKAHRVAIARGGELITILWALLTHAGIINRPSTAV